MFSRRLLGRNGEEQSSREEIFDIHARYPFGGIVASPEDSHV